MTGEDVNISSKDYIYHSEEKHEYKKSGLTVSVGGAMVGDRAKDWAKDKIPTDQDIQLTKGSSKRK